MATMKDVARLARVSTATVSHVINGTKNISEDTKKRVFDAIEQSSYVPNSVAKSLRVGSSLTIGVLVEDIRGLPVADIVNGIGEALEKNGYNMLLYDLHLLERLYNQYEQIGAYRANINRGISLLIQSHVDGIIYVGMHDRHLDGLIDPITRPIVFAYSHGSAQESYVTYANRESAVELVEYLISMGHSRIGVIAGHPHSYPTMMRLSGYQLALQKHGIPQRNEYVRYGDWEYESGARECAALIALKERPTAIFAMNDLMGIGCIHTLLEAGLRVPEDVSVVGFDNREASRYVQPPLTTMAMPTKEIGIFTANMLYRLIKNGGDSAEGVVLPCNMVTRESVRDIKGANESEEAQ